MRWAASRRLQVGGRDRSSMGEVEDGTIDKDAMERDAREGAKEEVLALGAIKSI